MRAACLLLAVLPLAAQTAAENPVKRQLKAGQPVIGATINVNSVDIAAEAANMGFDFLWIEMEHSPISWETLRHMVLATRGLKGLPFVRVPVNEMWTAKRALDSGALGVIFPFTNSVELARRAVAACRYPPVGLRGSGPGLAAFRWPSPEGYYKFANENVFVVLIIEDQPGVDNVDEIVKVPGIDAIFIGPSDLSHQLGVPNQPNHPKFTAAIDKIVAAAKRQGLPVGRPAGSPQQVEEFKKQGFTFFQGPTALSLMSQSARRLLDPMGKKPGQERMQTFY
ncbi:MAG: aldolase [Bryobacterales bacterium]|nr:aldolase [Bryobacterales bacterium]